MPPIKDDNKSSDVLTKGRRETTTGSTLSARDVVDEPTMLTARCDDEGCRGTGESTMMSRWCEPHLLFMVTKTNGGIERHASI